MTETETATATVLTSVHVQVMDSGRGGGSSCSRMFCGGKGRLNHAFVVSQRDVVLAHLLQRRNVVSEVPHGRGAGDVTRRLFEQQLFVGHRGGHASLIQQLLATQQVEIAHGEVRAGDAEDVPGQSGADRHVILGRGKQASRRER